MATDSADSARRGAAAGRGQRRLARAAATTGGVMAATPTQHATTPPQGCQGTTKAGAPCRGIVQNGRPWCLAHDPERQAELPGVRAKGAAASNKLRAIKGRRQKLDSAPALLRFVGSLVQDVLDGTVSPDVARAALYGVSIARQLVETSDLDARISALEEKAAATPQAGGRPRWRV
jgi:hypothetical protein